jgi:S-adenosylmethionine decarboxylase
MEYKAVNLFSGIHLLGELYGIPMEKITDVCFLEAVLRRGVELSGATVVSVHTHEFSPHGATLLMMLAESHVSVHTYPEYQALFFDAFLCGSRCKPHAISETLIAELRPLRHNLQQIMRGDIAHFTIPTQGRILGG